MDLSTDFYAASYAAVCGAARVGAAVLLQRYRWLYSALALAVCVWWSSVPGDSTTYISSRESMVCLGAFAVYYIAIVLFIISFINQTETEKV